MKTAKLVIVGDTNVGKTCIVNSIKGLPFTRQMQTNCVDNSQILVKTDKGNVEVFIYDTAGQEVYQSLSATYARDADITFLVFDLTSDLSFKNLVAWFDVMRNVHADNIVYVIGNKSDENNREVEDSNSAKMYIYNNFEGDVHTEYIEVSAKTGKNIDVLFKMAAEEFLDGRSSKRREEAEERSVNITECSKNKENDEIVKKKCCGS
ncbi:Ras-related protein Rab-37 [Tritrichomonas foetus]|uniref:Ras-related protein Rab-37 n=1 Tax=Tritrichomonas foetus TaxID=1144522 RepID=A0A1J4JZN6_9EUKA|nr:Ras-related protein Rab-37 [Tritrichomonas foetus]|eukprot:OHT04146.1 Ras-related protein Rab-37 [Tritrichomonas foetus]